MVNFLPGNRGHGNGGCRMTLEGPLITRLFSLWLK